LPEGLCLVSVGGAPLEGVATGCVVGEIKCCLTLNGAALTSSYVLFCYMNRKRSSVSIGMRYGQDSGGIGARFLSRANDFSLLYSVHTGSGAHSASCLIVPGTVSLGLKRQGREADH
jgi:hypothetical protein